MSYTLINVKPTKKIRISNEVKTEYRVRAPNGEEYIVLYWPSATNFIVYDAEVNEKFAHHDLNWFFNAVSYVCAKIDNIQCYMHAFLMYDVFNHEKQNGYTVDHINWIKSDNRRANLRLATQAQQNSNKGSRSDKEKPCQELIDAGVEELPKFVRWDKSESKFVIEKHPMLLKDVAQGLRKKASLSGTKSSKLSVIDKYQDILAKLQELYYDPEFENKRNALTAEFHAICQPVRDALGLPDNTAPTDNNQPVTADRKVVAGRKKMDSGLPPDCGITIQMVPKYCYYKPASATRGDAFAVDRHPTLTSHDKKSMLTTSSKSISTADKFKELLSILEQLDNGVIPPPRR
jgi:hypothetical protein